MSPPLISIVTPSFNQAEFLEGAIRSVIEQSYPNVEHIVLDGGSQDDSVEIIRRFEDHIAYWRSEPDDGQAAALREGFQRATGDILAWLNSDDLLADGALHRVAEAWERAEEEVIVAGGCRVFGGVIEHTHYPAFQERFGRPERMPLNRVLDMMRHWFPGEFFYQPEVFFPARAYHQVGGIDPTYYYTMDYDLWVRFALADVPVVVIPEVLAWYREHDGQKTADKRALYEEMVRTANAYLGQAGLPEDTTRGLIRSNKLALNPLVRTAGKALARMRGLIRAR